MYLGSGPAFFVVAVVSQIINGEKSSSNLPR